MTLADRHPYNERQWQELVASLKPPVVTGPMEIEIATVTTVPPTRYANRKARRAALSKRGMTMKMNDHERAIRKTLERCKKAIGRHDEEASWRVSCDISTWGPRRLGYAITCESSVLAIAPRKTERIGGVASTLEEAERLFITSVGMMVERKARQVERIRLRPRKRPLRDSEIPY